MCRKLDSSRGVAKKLCDAVTGGTYLGTLLYGISSNGLSVWCIAALNELQNICLILGACIKSHFLSGSQFVII